MHKKIIFRRTPHVFKRKTIKMRRIDSLGQILIQSDGLKIILDDTVKNSQIYNKLLAFCEEGSNEISSEKINLNVKKKDGAEISSHAPRMRLPITATPQQLSVVVTRKMPEKNKSQETKATTLYSSYSAMPSSNTEGYLK